MSLLPRRYGLALAQPRPSEQAAPEAAADAHAGDRDDSASGSAGAEAGTPGRRHLSVYQRRLLKKVRLALLGILAGLLACENAHERTPVQSRIDVACFACMMLELDHAYNELQDLSEAQFLHCIAPRVRVKTL